MGSIVGSTSASIRFLDEGGRISRWYGLLTDIDDQKRGRKRHSVKVNTTSDLLVETIPALVSRITAEGELDYVNQGASPTTSGRSRGYWGIRLDRLEDKVAHAPRAGRSCRSRAEVERCAEKRESRGKTRIGSGARTESIGGFYERSEPLLDFRWSGGLLVYRQPWISTTVRRWRKRCAAPVASSPLPCRSQLSRSCLLRLPMKFNQASGVSRDQRARGGKRGCPHDPPNLEKKRGQRSSGSSGTGISAAEVTPENSCPCSRKRHRSKLPWISTRLSLRCLGVLSEELRDNSIRR